MDVPLVITNAKGYPFEIAWYLVVCTAPVKDVTAVLVTYEFIVDFTTGTAMTLVTMIIAMTTHSSTIENPLAVRCGLDVLRYFNFKGFMFA